MSLLSYFGMPIIVKKLLTTKNHCELNKLQAHAVKVTSVQFIQALDDPLGITRYFFLEACAHIFGNVKSMLLHWKC